MVIEIIMVCFWLFDIYVNICELSYQSVFKLSIKKLHGNFFMFLNQNSSHFNNVSF